MEIDDLKTMWQAHETKLEKSTTFNLYTLDMIQSQRVKSAIKPLLVKNTFVLVSHTLTIVALIVFLGFNITSLPFSVSALVLLGYYVMLFINCYKQIMVIKSLDKVFDVISMQSFLTKLRVHILDFIRLSVLSIPALLSFPVVVPKALADLNINIFKDFDIVSHTNGSWWLVEIIAFTILIPVGIWFYNQVTPENIQKNWVKQLINRTTNKSVGRAVQYLNEMEKMRAGLN